MGGDLGPRVAFKACRKFLRFRRDVRLTIAVTADFAQEAESWFPPRRSRVSILVCDSFIEMNDKPAQMLRKGLSSTMAAVLREFQEGRAQGVLSIGNTGALMVLSRQLLGMYPGMDRPALATMLPTRNKPLLMLDLGANLSVDSSQLVQFACIGAAWSMVLNTEQPKVGLLNVGRESGKGTDCVKDADQQLRQMMPDIYTGFYEGNDLYQGELDVLVTDGFAGNITLKASEGLSNWLLELLQQEFRQHWLMKWFAWLWLPAVRRIERRVSPARHGGAMLLGVNGVVVKTHGNSDARAFRYALKYLHEKAARFDGDKLAGILSGFQQKLPSSADA
ncbi:phosphate acyltransferase PlsX [Thalassolituus sp. LLYu03]|uniref:phosphate acyltransferase PlsX n=1 Tax=Thalassolituus sp. LLYu03 TaxID=3421656 RepID=UPI003D28E542